MLFRCTLTPSFCTTGRPQLIRSIAFTLSTSILLTCAFVALRIASWGVYALPAVEPTWTSCCHAHVSEKEDRISLHVGLVEK
jgi:hypothetical protein